MMIGGDSFLAKKAAAWRSSYQGRAAILISSSPSAIQKSDKLRAFYFLAPSLVSGEMELA